MYDTRVYEDNTIRYEENFRRYFSDQTSDEFYRYNPELRAVDNGEGLFELAENKRVGMSEFEKFGCAKLEADGSTNPERSACRRAAAEEVVKSLTWNPRLARYYLMSVVDRDVASSILSNGEKKFYESYFPTDQRVMPPRPPSLKYPKGCTITDFVQVKDDRLSFSANNEGGLADDGKLYCRGVGGTIEIGADLTFNNTSWVNRSGIETSSDDSCIDMPQYRDSYFQQLIGNIGLAADYLQASGKDDEAFSWYILGDYLELALPAAQCKD